MSGAGSDRFSTGFLGGGRMAAALRDGLLRKTPAARIGVFDVDPARLEEWTALGCRAASSAADLFGRTSGWLVWAVKPQVFARESAGWKGLPFSGRGWISVMAGVTVERLQALAAPGLGVVRAMPNTPLLVGEGMTVLCAGGPDPAADLVEATAMFAGLGRVLTLPEAAMDGVTALSGSGPAYCFRLAGIVEAAAPALGLSALEARTLWAQTLVGAGRMLLESGQAPDELRRAVTSPGGTTQAALEVLDREGLDRIFSQALARARERSIELRG